MERKAVMALQNEVTVSLPGNKTLTSFPDRFDFLVSLLNNCHRFALGAAGNKYAVAEC